MTDFLLHKSTIKSQFRAFYIQLLCIFSDSVIFNQCENIINHSEV